MKSREKLSKALFNLAIRDHVQGPFLSGQSLDHSYLKIISLFGDLVESTKNNPDQQYGFKSFETGGQEPGAAARRFEDVSDMYSKHSQNTPNNPKFFRHLTRGSYANSTVPLSEKDMKRFLNMVHKLTNGKTIFKVFDYNSNIEEMKGCILEVKNMGAELEIAVPHSPDNGYMEFFKERFLKISELASEYEAAISVKRMVTGITEDEVREISDIVFNAAIKYGLTEVGLHAHGPVAKSAALFIKKGTEYGIDTNVDFVHHGNGGSFPSIEEIGEHLDKLGIPLDLTTEQTDILQEIDRLQLKRDKEYQGIRTGNYWSISDKINMGMPDGGESYSVQAIKGSRYSERLNIDDEEAKNLFKIFYIEFRERFGMPTSVTPGHKRAEMGAIHSIGKNLDLIKKHKPGNKIDLKELAVDLKNASYESLYQGIDAATVDAFRNDRLPQKLSDEAFQFLCQEHMRNFLQKGPFKDLDNNLKNNFIEYATDKEKIASLAIQANLSKDLTKGNKSIIAASGIREYLESDLVEERYQKCFEKISENIAKGADVKDANQAAIFSATLTGGDTTYFDGSYRGSMPSAANLTSQEYEAKKREFLINNTVKLSKKYETNFEKLAEMVAKGAQINATVNSPEDTVPSPTIESASTASTKEISRST